VRPFLALRELQLRLTRLVPLPASVPLHLHLLDLLRPALPFLARLVLLAILVLQIPLCALEQLQGLEGVPDLPPDFLITALQDSVPYLAMLAPLFLQTLVLPLLVPDPEVLLPQEHLVSLEVLIPRLLLAAPVVVLLWGMLGLREVHLELWTQVLAHLAVVVLVALLPPQPEVQRLPEPGLLVPLEVVVLLPAAVFWMEFPSPLLLQWLR